MPKIKTLIVDDSALMRNLLTQILSSAPDIEVVGTASDPYDARDKIKRLNPDVLTLDIEMPRMNGLTFLSNLMRLRPMPVIMLSSLTQEGADITMQALANGAVDFIPKPELNTGYELEHYARELISKIRIASASRVREYSLSGMELLNPNPNANPSTEIIKTTVKANTHPSIVIAVGASTGGTEAIKQVVCNLPSETPPILISQHLPLAFSASFARHVDRSSQMRAQLAENGMVLESGNIYIAPGGQHLRVKRKERTRHIIELDNGKPVNRHKPSVDVMFYSVSEVFGSRCLGILLTGMGADGALGLKIMHDAGASTMVQDEHTSIVWGMPGEAHRLGAADYVLPLGKIPSKILALLGQLNS
ncbi:MAG: protein-glutamate methylesterase/protein-glutamine glutaminase [Methylococcaceae bacterium]